MSILPYEVTRPLESAENTAFSFVRKENKYQQVSTSKSDHITKVGGIKAFWVIMSFVGIPLAIVFGIYEAYMAQAAIASFIDPMGNGNVSTSLIGLIGAGLATFAIYVGHIFAEGLGKETNQHTGRNTYNIGLSFYFSIVGLIGYVWFQYYLVQAAGEGEFNSFAMVAVGVAILEILVGVLILGKALTYLLIFLSTIQLGLLSKSMKRTSRNTNMYYRDYRTMRDVWNKENPLQFMELEGNENIRRAIAYYSGVSLNSNNETPSNNNVEAQETSSDEVPPTEPTTQSEGETTEDEIEDFIDDSENVKF